MGKQKNGTRFEDNYLWEDKKYTPYDYEKQGLLQHIMSRVIVNSKNPALQSILYYFESSLIYLMKYVDYLKYIKDYHHYNR